MKKKGFTLVELLAVIIVLAMLLAIIIPNALKMRNNVKMEAYISKIELLEKSAVFYGKDNIDMLKKGINNINGEKYSYVCKIDEDENKEITSISFNKFGNYSPEVLKDGEYWCIKTTVKDLADGNYFSYDETNYCSDCSDNEKSIYNKVVLNSYNYNIINNCNVYVYYKNNRPYAYFDKKTCDSASTKLTEGHEYPPHKKGGNDTVNPDDPGISTTKKASVGEVVVSFDTKSESKVKSVIRKENATYGELPLPTKKGSAFDGWYFEDIKITDNMRLRERIDHELYAKWIPIKYEISFNSQGGSSTEKKEIYYGQSYGELPIPSKTGYTFKGWFLNTNYDNEIKSEAIFDYAEDITLFAKWEANKYNVSFANTCDSKLSSIVVTYDSTYKNLPTAKCEGYYLVGWYREDSYTNKVDASTVVKDLSDITLYAKWKEEVYELVFDSQGGTPVNKKEITFNSTYGKLDDSFRTGYTFKGWYSEIKDGSKVTSSTKVTTKSPRIIYAHWTANSYTVTFDANGGNKVNTVMTVTYDSPYGNTLPPATRTGYDFAGWYTAASGGTNVNANTILKTASTHVLYAHWTPKQYTIYYNANGGTASASSKKVTYAANIGSLASALRAGYVFGGWTYNNKTISSTQKYTYTSDITVTAIMSACAAGTYNEGNSNSCKTCSAGTYSGAGAGSCTKCSAGTYSGAGATGCTACPSGTVSGAGAGSCSKCGAGTYASNRTQCLACAGGYYSGGGTTSCSQCSAGTYSGAGSSGCTACASGYVSGAGASACSRCGAGTYALNRTQCVACSGGYYSGGGVTSCSQCWAGTYSGSGAGSCTACPAGTSSSAGASYCSAVTPPKLVIDRDVKGFCINASSWCTVTEAKSLLSSNRCASGKYMIQVYTSTGEYVEIADGNKNVIGTLSPVYKPSTCFNGTGWSSSVNVIHQMTWRDCKGWVRNVRACKGTGGAKTCSEWSTFYIG